MNKTAVNQQLIYDRAILAAIIDSSDDAIISKDLNGIVQSWNPAAERIFGYSADEMIGRSITKLFPLDRLDEEPKILERLKRGERIDHFETIRHRKDGSALAISVTISPIHDDGGNIIGASKIARDITKSSELEGKFKEIISSSDDAIISKDLNGIVQSWNPAAERIFGYTADYMIGKSITILFPPDRLDEEPHILERIRRGERVDHFETIRRHMDGRLLDVSVTISPVKDSSGRVIGVSKVARDISSIRRMLQEREELFEREKVARQEAERISRMKDEFLATLSHELRAPLNSILGWSSLLLKKGKPSPDELQLGLDTIVRNARSQAQLVEELLDMSRIVSGKLRLNVHPIDLNTVIMNAIETIRPAADAKGIRLSNVLDRGAGLITGDSDRIQQVLWNLLTNAIKFTPKDGHVRVFLRRVNSHVEIAVQDSGQGFTEEFSHQLFARFTQAESSKTRKHGGLGLGLSLAKALVEAHGGTIEGSSAGVDQGSLFVISLPLMVDRHFSPGETLTPAPSQQADIPFPDLSGFHVLVVDDELDARTLIEHILASCKATVTTAGSSAEGINALKKHRPDMIVSDIGMPEEDGYQFLSKVRQLSDDCGGNTPAVALTAFARVEDGRRALMVGYQMHLSKPVEAAELLAVTRNIYASKRQA